MGDYIPDYNDLYDAYEAKQERLIDRLPKCAWCGEPIMDDYLYDFDGDTVCEACVNDMRKAVDNYVR